MYNNKKEYFKFIVEQKVGKIDINNISNLEKAKIDVLFMMNTIIKIDDDLDFIKNDSKFDELLKNIGNKDDISYEEWLIKTRKDKIKNIK